MELPCKPLLLVAFSAARDLHYRCCPCRRKKGYTRLSSTAAAQRVHPARSAAVFHGLNERCLIIDSSSVTPKCPASVVQVITAIALVTSATKTKAVVATTASAQQSQQLPTQQQLEACHLGNNSEAVAHNKRAENTKERGKITLGFFFTASLKQLLPFV